MNKFSQLNTMDALTLNGPFSREEANWLNDLGRLRPKNGLIGAITTTNLSITQPPSTLQAGLFATAPGERGNVWRRFVTLFSTNAPIKGVAGSYTTGSNSNSFFLEQNGTLRVNIQIGQGSGGASSPYWGVTSTITGGGSLPPIRKVSAGADWSVVVSDSGGLWSTGSGTGFRTGQNATSVSGNWTNISQGFTDWENCMAGADFGYAVRSNGWLYSWGNNINGGTAQGTTAAGSTTIPTRVGTDSDWTGCKLIRVSGTPVVAIVKTNGTVWVAGLGQNSRFTLTGTIGLGTLTQLPGLPASPVVDFAIGPTWSVALCADGTIWGCRTISSVFSSVANTTTTFSQIGTHNDWKACWSNGNANRVFLQKTNGSLWAGMNNSFTGAGNGGAFYSIPLPGIAVGVGTPLPIFINHFNQNIVAEDCQNEFLIGY